MRDYSLFVPEYIAAIAAILIIGIELFVPKFPKTPLAYLTALAAAVWFGAGLFYLGDDPKSFQA